MGLARREVRQQHDIKNHQELIVSVHVFSDLSHVSPVVFLYLLKACYAYGTCKATPKFRVLQQVVHQALYNAPQPGPAIFVARCLCVLPIFEQYREGFSHLVISAFRHFLKTGTTHEDLPDGRLIAARIFLDIVEGNVAQDDRILVKIVEVFGVDFESIAKVSCTSDAKDVGLDAAKSFVEQYILKLIESGSYMIPVTLLEHFSIRNSEEAFLFKIIESKQYEAAEKWATFMGKPMLLVLVQQYIDRDLLKFAYEIIKKNHLHQEFPEVYLKCKESSLKKLAEKGCWDIAESRANNDTQLLEYLVYLAMEAGYPEKVDELCDRHSLKGFVNVKKPEANSHYLGLNELVVGDIIWVDESNSLCEATYHIEECKLVGLDCEWKPNYEKGSKPNKVSIMQISTEKIVYILDLIKLFEEVPDVLDDCLIRILHSSRILKLGYNFQCDMHQLAHSYGDLECFKHFEMLLDIQNIFKEVKGGLSGLARKILGAGLNKTRRNSNWEQRPLTRNQLEYAALDAAVLIHIFLHVHNQSQPADSSDCPTKIAWKSYIISHMDNLKKIDKGTKKKKAARKNTVPNHPQ